MERNYPSQPREIRKHLFKLLYRALQQDPISRDFLANCPLKTEEDKKNVRHMIHRLNEMINEKGDAWQLPDCTLLTTSWYRRYRK